MTLVDADEGHLKARDAMSGAHHDVEIGREHALHLGGQLTGDALALAVPMALVGTVGVLTLLHVANSIYVQIGLVLLIAPSAKNEFDVSRRCSNTPPSL